MRGFLKEKAKMKKRKDMERSAVWFQVSSFCCVT